MPPHAVSTPARVDTCVQWEQLWKPRRERKRKRKRKGERERQEAQHTEEEKSHQTRSRVTSNSLYTAKQVGCFDHILVTMVTAKNPKNY